MIKSRMAIISPKAIDTASTAIVCFVTVSWPDDFLELSLQTLEEILLLSSLVVHCISHNFTSFTSNRLLSFLVQSMCLTESTILFGFHSVRMSLLILGHVIVTLLAFCTCQCDLCAHDFHLHLNFRCCYSAILLLSGSHALRCRKT